MRDDQKRALLADGGKGEAVYQYKVRDLSGWHDCDAGAYERITTNMPEHVEARTLFTAPQAIGKGEAVALWAAFSAEGNLLAHSKLRQGLSDILNWEPLYRTAPQAECAPREDEKRCEYCDGTGSVHRIDGEYLGECTECAPRGAQPVTEILRLLSKMHDECGTNAGQDALWDAHEAVEQLLAAPTPERAQESAGVRLTPEQSGAIQIAVSILSPEYQLTANRLQSILAANKEPQP